MSIIIPSEFMESIKVPMKFPLKADGDSVVDANGVSVLKVATSVSAEEAVKFAKLFAQAPTMFELLGHAYGLLVAIGINTEGFTHGSPDEQDKENCILCQCESILNAVQ